MSLERKSRRLANQADKGFPWVLVLLIIALCAVLFALSGLAIVNSQQRDSEKTRGDLLQKSVDSLRKQVGENQNFFELLKGFLTAQNEQDRQLFTDQLRALQFTSTPSATTTTSAPRTTSTTRSPSVTPATQAPSTTTTTRPPSTTTTTQASSPPTSSPPPRPCTTIPVVGRCPPVGA